MNFHDTNLLTYSLTNIAEQKWNVQDYAYQKKAVMPFAGFHKLIQARITFVDYLT